jgi:Fic family protein
MHRARDWESGWLTVSIGIDGRVSVDTARTLSPTTIIAPWLLLYFGSNLAIQSFETRDEQEVAGYAELMDLVFSSWRDIPFNEGHFKQLHQILLRHSEKDARHRGQYKTSSNSVAAFDENGQQIAIVFETASPFDTPHLMAELVAWVNDERDKAHLHPLLFIAIFVVVFLEIHPFQDENGRLSRVLTTLLGLRNWAAKHEIAGTGLSWFQVGQRFFAVAK